MELKRVVVTGLGAVTPVGNTPEETWENLLAGKSGAAPITHFVIFLDYDCKGTANFPYHQISACDKGKMIISLCKLGFRFGSDASTCKSSMS